MRAGDDPHRLLARTGLADGDAGHVAPLHRLPQPLRAHARRGLRRGHQRQVALVGIGLEISKPDAVVLGRDLDGERPAVVARRHAEPVPAVVGRDGLVVLPARRVGALTGVLQRQPARLPLRALQAEVEPLREIGVRIAADAQPDGIGARGIDDLDGAAVECAGDVRLGGGHGQSCRARCGENQAALRRKTQRSSSETSAANA